jgi:hypothetical protein
VGFGKGFDCMAVVVRADEEFGYMAEVMGTDEEFGYMVEVGRGGGGLVLN